MPPDYTDDASTTGYIQIGQTILSELDNPTDQDWFRIFLDGGLYRFDLKVDNPEATPLLDPLLRLFDMNGNFLAFSDDAIEGSTDSAIIISLPKGMYFIAAGGYAESFGTYAISATKLNAPPSLAGPLTATVLEGDKVTLTTAMVDGLDPDDSYEGLFFTVTDLLHGKILVNGIEATTFTHTQLVAGAVVFQHEGSEGASAGFQILLSDGGEDGSQAQGGAFSISVTAVNDAPRVETPLGPQSVDEDTAWSYQIPAGTFIDADSALSLSATLADGSALPDWMTFDATTRIFSGTPPKDWNGALSIKVNASDGEFGVDTTFSFFAVAVNDAPKLGTAPSSQSVAEDTLWSYQLPADTFTDVDSALFLSATLVDGSALPDWLIFNATTRTFSGTPPKDWNGALSVKVGARDGEFGVDTTFSLAVTAVNDAPFVVMLPAAQSVAEDSFWSYRLPEGTFSDVDSDIALVATLSDGSALPHWITFDPMGRTLSGTPPQDWNGLVSIKVSASDGEFSAEATFALAVTAVNDAPRLAIELVTQNTAEDTAWSYQLPANTFVDVDNSLVLSATLADGSALPTWVTFDSINGVFRGTPPKDWSGALAFKIVASDGEFHAMTTFALSVAAVNDAPHEIALSSATIMENSIGGTVVGSLSALDVDNDRFDFTLVDDAGGRFAVQDGRLVVKAGANLDYETAHTHQVTLRAQDAGGLSIEKSFIVDVGDIVVEKLVGSSNSDKLVGGSGSDILYGKAGKDTLFGGGGKDIFVFDAKPLKSNIDRVLDFSVVDDTIHLAKSVFKALSKKGSLKKDAFHLGARAHDSSDRIVYDKKSGALYYDADGVGAVAQVQIATLSKKMKLTYKDFFII